MWWARFSAVGDSFLGALPLRLAGRNAPELRSILEESVLPRAVAQGSTGIAKSRQPTPPKPSCHSWLSAWLIGLAGNWTRRAPQL